MEEEGRGKSVMGTKKKKSEQRRREDGQERCWERKKVGGRKEDHERITRMGKEVEVDHRKENRKEGTTLETGW